MTRRLIVLGVCAVVLTDLSGCGAFHRGEIPGYTQVSIQRGVDPATDLMDSVNDMLSPGFNALAAPNADIVVFASDTTVSNSYGTHVFSTASSAASDAWSIPNGTYTFSAIGFNGAYMGTSSQCGQAVGDNGSAGGTVTLSGGTKNLTINTSGTACSSAPFTSSSSLSVNFCSNSFSSGETFTASGCSTLSPTNTAASVTGSVRISYVNESDFGGSAANPAFDATATPALSTCITLSSGAGSKSSPLPLIASSPSAHLGLKMYVTLFTGASCTGLDTARIYAFPHGISDYTHMLFNGTENSTQAGYGSSTFLNLFLKY